MQENMEGVGPDFEAKMTDLKKQEDEFLKNALEGFITAKQTENYPMCGMDEHTVDYIIAVLAMYNGQYDISSKLISSILANTTVSHRMKEKTRDAKEELIARLKEKR